MDKIKTNLLVQGEQLGLKKIRIIPAEPLADWEKAVNARKQLDPDTADYWTKRNLIFDPRGILPEAKSIIAAVCPYRPYPEQFPQNYGSYSAHYTHYPIARDAMVTLSRILTEQGYKAVVNPPLPIKAIALKSGLGYFGKNGLLHNEEFGSWMTLHIILTDADLPVDLPGTIYSTDFKDNITDCGNCSLCIKACPTGAIKTDGTVILSRCLRHHMLSGEIVPDELREAMGTKILGCEHCQLCCPKNMKIAPQQGWKDSDEPAVFSIIDIMRNQNSSLKQITDRIARQVGKNYARAQKILTSAVIAAGNTLDPLYIPWLEQTLTHKHIPIRVHSAWALGRIGGHESLEILKKALDVVTDSLVLKEIKTAIRRIESRLASTN